MKDVATVQGIVLCIRYNSIQVVLKNVDLDPFYDHSFSVYIYCVCVAVFYVISGDHY